MVHCEIRVEPLYNPDILAYFYCNIEVFPLLEVKNVLVTPVGTKKFVLINGGFSIVSLIQQIC